MLHQILTAVIAKAGRKSIHQSNRAIGRAQQQRSRIRITNPASKAASTIRPSTIPKSNCSAQHSVGIGASSNHQKVVAAQQLSLIRRPDALNCVRNLG
ncbi:hypothetical protein ACFIOY_18765 [Bradyrhizobium sp. TZ2]